MDSHPQEIVEAVPVEANDLDRGNSDEIIDLEIAGPAGTPCDACGCPIEQGDRFCPACGTPNPAFDQPASAQAKPDKKFIRCESCGSEITTDLDHRSYTCPFCDSTYVVEFAPDQSHRQPPEFVIGFAINPEQATEKFHAWLNTNSWYRPGDLQQARIDEKLKGIYLPFWSFSMLADSRWRSSIGEYWYRTETYTTVNSKGKPVVRTRQVRETEWWPLNGKHHRYYSGFLVSGSHGLPQSQAERIKPFNLPALKRYEPFYLAGWISEEYSVERDEARQLCEQEFLRREQSNIAAFLPGDTHRDLHVTTDFSQVNSDLILLPVYLLSYRYKDKLYQFMINGQTGKMDGDKPVSGMRIGMLIGGIALLLLCLIIILVVLGAIGG